MRAFLMSDLVEAEQFTAAPVEARQFDFWLGEWDCTWDDDGRGTNSVQAILDGHVVLEQFTGQHGATIRGMSVSTYMPELGRWQQTWVDNYGNYLPFSGRWRDDHMELITEDILAGRVRLRRMRWYNIGPDELDWSWEQSLDGGVSWEPLWQIHYRRRA
jgi:hypothetical protein